MVVVLLWVGRGGLLGDVKWPGENATYCRYLKSLSTVIIGICLRVKVYYIGETNGSGPVKVKYIGFKKLGYPGILDHRPSVSCLAL